MSRSLPNDVGQMLGKPKGEVKQLLDQLTKIKTLNNTLQDKLNATLSIHARVVNLRQNTLVIAVDSPAWSNKLRFMLPELLDHFRDQGFYGLANIELIVQPR